ncbi:DUF4232 domain-containing protein [Streptomycetaceae bacterium NBC_01309]
MHGSEHRTHGDDVPFLAPHDAGSDARRRRNRRTGWAACTVSAVAAAAVVSTVALTGGGEKRETVLPPPGPLVAAALPETVSTTLPGPAQGGATDLGNPGTPAAGPAGTPSAASAPRAPSTPSAPSAPSESKPSTVKPGATKPGVTKPEAASAKGGAAGTDSTSGKTAIAPCTTEALAVSSQKEPPDATDTRHLLITVQNAGSTTCNLYRHPYILLGNGQGPAPVIEDSDPDPGVPVTLAPGKEAYAAMVLNGPMDEYEVTSISLTLQGSAPGSKAGGPIDVPMPGATPLYANDFQRVTYWTTAPGYALDFVMSK